MRRARHRHVVRRSGLAGRPRRIFARIDPIADGREVLSRGPAQRGRLHLRRHLRRRRHARHRSGEIIIADQIGDRRGEPGRRGTGPGTRRRGLPHQRHGDAPRLPATADDDRRRRLRGGGVRARVRGAGHGGHPGPAGAAAAARAGHGHLRTFTDIAAGQWDLGWTPTDGGQAAAGRHDHHSCPTARTWRPTCSSWRRVGWATSTASAWSTPRSYVAEGRVTVDEHERTSVDGVWALGDVSNSFQLKHVANLEARTVQTTRSTLTTSSPATIGSCPAPRVHLPQIATVGLTEQQAQERGVPTHSHRRLRRTSPMDGPWRTPR